MLLYPYISVTYCEGILELASATTTTTFVICIFLDFSFTSAGANKLVSKRFRHFLGKQTEHPRCKLNQVQDVSNSGFGQFQRLPMAGSFEEDNHDCPGKKDTY
ncbi:conserved hypothetical protein [Trichinella spiralis]|uniref:hypothetical protein n=1 Tax=Trichinella spiralis TaxID=6334 RepID=UPI0001EFD2AC|nr:conserved hypothetical protein [Trichinella spiralis]